MMMLGGRELPFPACFVEGIGFAADRVDAMSEPTPTDMIETCRRRAASTHEFAQKIVKGKARQFLLTLAGDYERAADALERGEKIDGRIRDYLNEGTDVRKG